MDALDFSAASADLEIDLAAAQVTADLNMLSYSGIEKIIAGAGNDKFYIVGSQSMDIYSGPGDDCFIFSSDGSLMGIIDGESGHDTLDYSASNSGRRIILTGIGLQDGFNGEEIDSISAGFANMEGFIGGQEWIHSGLDADAEFNIYSDRVEYSSDGRTMIITGVENLLGGNENDQFIFHDQAQLPGDSNSINGQGGSNTLDYSKYSSGRTIILTALGSLNGFAGKDSSMMQSVLFFDNIQFLRGSDAGSDTLQGLDTDSIYRITGTSTGSYENNGYSLSFVGIEILNGGSGQDCLDFSSMDSSRNVFLKGISANGFAGDEAAIPGGFTGMDILVGSVNTDTFTGLDEEASFIITDTVMYCFDDKTLRLTAWENPLVEIRMTGSFSVMGLTLMDYWMDVAVAIPPDYSAYQQRVKVVVTGVGDVDGFCRHSRTDGAALPTLMFI